MFESIGKMFGKSSSSAKVAKSRLQLVVARERAGIPESKLNQLKSDLYGVISQYFEIDQDSLEIEILNRNGESALTVNTSVNRISR